MGLDFRNLGADPPRPSTLRVAVEEDAAAWEVEDLPYYRADAVPRLHALTRAPPQRVWRFGAWLEGRFVGHAILNLTAGPLGVAGLYNIGVVSQARGQGIGTALTVAACRLARELGVQHALLNATPLGERVYRRVGFATIGHGQTWWLSGETLMAPPSPAQVALAEAVGQGDVAALDARVGPAESETLDAPLPCGMTPLQLAVQTGQPAAAAWLVRRGATLDVLSAWDLGWKEAVPELLRRTPDLANRRSGEWQVTPLHVAAQRGDVELARLLLTADPDLEIQDTQFHSTPLGWARHFQRAEIVELIERYQARHPRGGHGGPVSAV
jgi:GNAT superfamily N-acetyltransferase